MANPTSNFNWQMPTNTDLVKDLPADFEVFGQAVDTSLADLKGGTSGQILSKNSNTDMDFVWINNDQGDITAITASSPLTGGGTSGAITVGIQDSTTAQKGAVQLENSTSSTSTTTAAVPASVKSAYDLADAAIPKSTVTTNGDLIYGTGSATVTRLGIGTTGQVLTVAGGVPSWAAASGSALKYITKSTFSSSSAVEFDNCFSSTYDNYLIIGDWTTSGTQMVHCRYRTSGSNNTNNNYVTSGLYNLGSGLTAENVTLTSLEVGNNADSTCGFAMEVISPNLSKRTVAFLRDITSGASYTNIARFYNNLFSATTVFDGISFYPASGTFTGTITIYGYSLS